MARAGSDEKESTRNNPEDNHLEITLFPPIHAYPNRPVT